MTLDTQNAAMPQVSGRTRRRISRLLKVFLGLCIAGACVWFGVRAMGFHLPRRGGENAGVQTKDRFFTAAKGNFTITLSLDGTLDAIKRHDLKCDAKSRWRFELVEVVADRAEVKAGDVVARFSSSEAKEVIDKLKQELDDAQTEMRLAVEDLEMAKASNLNSTKFAADAVRAAVEELQKYDEQDAPKKKRELNAAIAAAEAKVVETVNKVTECQKALGEAQLQDQDKQEELAGKVAEAEKLATQARSERENAVDGLRVFKRYDHPMKMRSLKEAVTKSRMSLQKALVEASSTLIVARTKIKNIATKNRMLENQLSDAERDLLKMVLTAPVDGVVSLGNPMERYYREEAKEVKVGAEFGQNEIVAYIPDLSRFMVLANVPEEYRSRIALEQPVLLRSKAIPDLKMSGKISYIAPMGMPQIRWDPNSPKIYQIKISTDATDLRLMPGMTMSLEIMVEEVKNVVYVPVEAVYNREGAACCQAKSLSGMTEKKVETGRSSTDYVEIQSGLKEGDEVLLVREQRSSI